MPIYRYKCDQCAEEVEVIQSMQAEALSVCENCGGRLRKMIGRVGIKFNGSGYYVTDVKKNNFSTSIEPKTDSKPVGKEAKTEPDSKKAPEKSETEALKKEAV